jgi:predicted RNA-binding Zn-ribbon protein involved in translation (DUF1610 family)
MKHKNIKRTWSRPFYVNVFRHYCPNCNTLLSKTKVSKIINSQSLEAKDYDFASSGGEGYMYGDVKFIWTEFLCHNCGKQVSINEMIKIEKEQRKYGHKLEKLRDIEETVRLLGEILEEVDHEVNNIKNGHQSPWSIEVLEDVVKPEMNELLTYAKKGLRFYKYGKKHNMLESVYFMTDSREHLSLTSVGKKIHQLKH